MNRWTARLTIAMAAGGSHCAFDCIGPQVPLLARQLRFTGSNTGLLQAFPNLVTASLWGSIIDRFGAMRSVTLFSVLTIVGLVVTPLTPNLGVLVPARPIVTAVALATVALECAQRRIEASPRGHGLETFTVRG